MIVHEPRRVFNQEGSNPICVNIIYVPDIVITKTVALPTEADWKDLASLFADMTVQVLVLDHNIHLKSSSSWNELLQQGDSLLSYFQKMRSSEELNTMPSIIIGERFGGFVIKRLFQLSQNSTNPDWLDRIEGLVFLGTPHDIQDTSKGHEKLSYLLRTEISFVRKRVLNRENITTFHDLCHVFGQVVSVNRPGLPILSVCEANPVSLRWSFKSIVVLDSEYTTVGAGEEKSISSAVEVTAVLREAHKENISCACRAVREQIGKRIHKRLEKSKTISPSQKSGINISSHQSLITPPSSIGLPTPESSPSGFLQIGSSPRVANVSQGLEGGSLYEPSSLDIKSAGSFSSFASRHSRPSGHERLVTSRAPIFLMQARDQNERYFPRDELLKELDSALLPAYQAASLTPNPGGRMKTFVIHGYSGTGKTELAIDFVFKRRMHFHTIFWVPADARELLDKAYCEIATELGFYTAEEAAKDIKGSKDKVISWLKQPWMRIPSSQPQTTNSSESTDREVLANWLMIYDNADELEPLLEYLPTPSPGRGALLVTTRKVQAKTFSFFGPIGLEMPLLGFTDAEDFLSLLIRGEKGRISTREKAAAGRIITRLGGSPFALVQVASLATQKGLSLEQFDLIYLKREGLVELFSKEIYGQLQRRYGHNSLASAWAQRGLSEKETKVLNSLALFQPDSISEKIFLKPNQSPVLSFLKDAIEWHETIGGLYQNSQVKRKEGGSELQMHRIVRDCAISRMLSTEGQFSEAFHRAVAVIKESWPYAMSTGVGKGHETTRWAQCLLLFGHIRNLLQIFIDHRDSLHDDDTALQFAKLVSEAAWYQYQLGLSVTAYELIEKALSMLNHLVHQDAFRLRSDLFGTRTNIALDLSDPNKAYKHALAWLELEEDRYKQTKTPTPELAAANNSMGAAEASCGLYRSAEVHLLRSKDLRESLPGFKPAHNYSPLWAMGVSSYLEGKYEVSKSYLMRALREREEEYGSSDQSGRTGCLYLALGNTFEGLNKIDESFKYHKKALEYFQTTVGNDHRITANASYKMACHYIRLGIMAEALNALDVATATYEKNDGYLPHTARCLFQSSHVMAMMKATKKSQDILKNVTVLMQQFAPSKRLSGEYLTDLALLNDAVPWDA
ncbi:hypothetical protein BDV12DRAFT_173749, partial [Aspergillus spectabilis]